VPKTKRKKLNLPILVRRAGKTDGDVFLSLINALADYEKLKRPNRAARTRLFHDAHGTRKRFETYIAWYGKRAVGYAIIFETYSSFLALPTLYLEDIFVLEEFRSKGVGRELFKTCLGEARRRGCGRMEWVVLNWNTNAIRFYKKVGAHHLHEWDTFRIDKKSFPKILKKM